jgi:type II secretory pathway pseudopilin PulG
MLVEALVGVGIVAIVAGAALAGVATVTHSAAHELSRSALRATAQNVLTDLRAATAYDPIELAGLSGTSVSFSATDGDSPTTITVRVGIASDRTYPATVEARAADGTTVTLDGVLAAEAPAPGTIDAPSSPEPAATPAAGTPADDADTLRL